jgi:hypothetical protein
VSQLGPRLGLLICEAFSQAFNHEHLKADVIGSFLLAKRKMWPDISNRLKSLNHGILKNISDKLLSGARFSPTMTEEKKYFRLLNDLDHVGGPMAAL